MSLLTPFISLLKEGKFRTAMEVTALYKPFYKLVYLATLKNSGLMDRLSSGPVGFDELALKHSTSDKSRDALESWLAMGCSLKVLAKTSEGYRLVGLAQRLSRPENDAILALMQEVGGLYYNLVTKTPEMAARGELWQLDNQDSNLVARSSRALEPFVLEAIKRYVPRSTSCKLLEVGCGSGVYIRYAAQHNPQLQAVGLELQEEVAKTAQENAVGWGLGNKIEILCRDVRNFDSTDGFDVITLHNNIYYFSLEERVEILKKLCDFLAPGGKLLVTTCCQGGSIGMAALNLWGASNQDAGRLPEKDEMVAQLIQAGYGDVDVMQLIPGDSYYACAATKALA